MIKSNMYHYSMKNKGVKLVAHDGETVHILSTLLQDGITCGQWILYKNNTLKILINRVCWEKSKSIYEEENYIQRVHSIFTIENIISIKTKNVFKKKIEFYSILSLICEIDERKNTYILQILFTKGIIKIEVEKFYVTIKDISTYLFNNGVISSSL